MNGFQRRFSIALFLMLPLFFVEGCNQAAQQGSSVDGALAKVDGTLLTSSSLSNRHRMNLYQAETEYYRKRQEIVEGLISERLMEEEAKKAGITPEVLRKREIEDKVPLATEAEINDFYQKNKDRIEQRLKQIPKGEKRPSTAEIKDTIGKQLAQRRFQERYQSYMGELRSAHKVELLMKEPQAPRVEIGTGENNPSKGSKDAKVTIVEFSDFQCPFCSRAVPVISQIESAYGDKVRIVFRDFPLSFHQTAKKQAEAAGCANEQGKFWAYHDKLFASQDKVGSSFGGGNETALMKTLTEFANEVGANPDDFSKCLASNKYAEEVENDIKAGEEAGVSSTPSFFINGRLLAGAQPFDEFKRIIDEELKK